MTDRGAPLGLALARSSPAHSRAAALAALIAAEDHKGYMEAKKVADAKHRARHAAQQERLT